MPRLNLAIKPALERCLAWARAHDLLRAPRFTRTSSFELTLLYAGLLTLSTVVLFGLVYWLATSYVAAQIDSAISTEITEEQADAQGHGLAGLKAVVSAQAARASPDAFYLLQDASGSVLAGNLPHMEPVLGIREWEVPSGVGVRGRGIRAPDGAYLLVGLADSDLRELRLAIANAFFWVLLGAVTLAVLGGSMMSFGVLRRVEAISRASRRIIAGDLDQRIEVRGTNDEFDHLASSLNAMLDRIQSLMDGLRQVSSDIAHDLRTPLSRHRQRLELARLHGRTANELRDALDHSIRDVDSILETFGALLRIAKIGSAAEGAEFAPLDLGELVEDVVEAYRAVAEERDQTLACSTMKPLPIHGNRELLTQLIANLVENALTHTPSGTAITVSAATEAGAPTLYVRDNGPGVPLEYREKILRPFYRLEKSRTTPGTGLGLSLVAAIADLHRARIELSDGNPGLLVRLHFPAALPGAVEELWWVAHVRTLLLRWLPEPLSGWAIDLLASLSRRADELRVRVSRLIRP